MKSVEEMDIIELTRELGRKLQQEDVFIKYQLAKTAADEDEELQELINEFNLKRIAINEKAGTDEENTEKFRELNAEMRKVYAKIMTNERMMHYNDAKDIFDAVMNRINAIISQCADGGDPDTADFMPSCSGSCATCGGCG